MVRRLIPILLVSSLAAAAYAQGADPTRPPYETAAPLAQGQPQPAPPGGLQSIMRRKGGKPAAMIDGVVVELGGKVGEARLIRIGEDFVVLRGPQGVETLYLTPGIAKKSVRKEKR